MVAVSAGGAIYLTACAEPAAEPVSETVQWPEYGGEKSHQRYSPASQINAETVAGLDIAWIWESPDTGIDQQGLKDQAGTPITSSAFKTTPIVVDGRMYVRSSFSMVSALDPATGEMFWSFDPRAYEAPLPGNFGHSSRGLAHVDLDGEPRVISVASDGRIFALDPQTGTPIKSFGEAGIVHAEMHLRMPDGAAAPAGQYAFYTPPLICNGTIILGFAVPRTRPLLTEDGHAVPFWTRGDVLGFDARTGAFKWRFETTPSVDLQEEGQGRIRGGKANVWSSMSCDEELGLAYLPVAGASENFIGIHRVEDDDYSQSIVALDPGTGHVRWHYQTIHHGLWDYDLVSAPSLVDLETDAGQVQALVQLNKTGLVYVLDRATGDPVWPIPEVDVPASSVAGESAASTQPMPTVPKPVDVQAPLAEKDLVDLTPELQANARRVYEVLAGQGLFTPIGPEPTLLLPGVAGGPNWGGAGFDPADQMLFIPSQTNPFIFSLQNIPISSPAYASSTMGLQLRVENRMLGGMPITRPPYSRITAVDMRTGEHAWVAPNGSGYNSHPALAELADPGPLGSNGISGILVTPDLVFSADSGAYSARGGGQSRIRAFRKQDGEIVWEVPLPAAYSGAAPMTYVADGVQYLVIAVGGNASPSIGSPAYLVAYSLSGAGAELSQDVNGERATELSGEELFTSNGCGACHGPAGIPLVGLDHYSDTELAELIRDPQSEMMPAFALSDADINVLIAYLREQK